MRMFFASCAVLVVPLGGALAFLLQAPRHGIAEAAAAEAPPRLLFHATFDSTMRAEEAGGSPEPIVHGTPAFEAGIVGRAVVVGDRGATVSYEAAANLLPAQGTVAFWLKPLDWEPPDSLHRAWWATEGGSPLLLGKVAYPPDGLELGLRADRLPALDGGQLEAAAITGVDPRAGAGGPGHALRAAAPPSLRARRWTHLAFTWGAAGTGLFVNGTLVDRHDAPATVVAARFRVGDFLLTGTRDPQSSLVDDLRIYDRPLSGDELADLCMSASPQMVFTHLEQHGAQGHATLHLGNLSPPARVDVEVVGDGSATPAGRFSGVGEGRTLAIRIPTEGLAPGAYAVRGTAAVASGARAIDERMLKPETPWRHDTTGVSDRVPPPFTPVRVVAESPLTLAVWGRTIVFGSDGLPTSIVAAGRELLAAPVRLASRGQATAGAGVEVLARSDAAVRIGGRATLRGAAVRVATTVEYDGLLVVDVELERGGLELDDLSLVIPLVPQHASFRLAPPWETSNHYAGLILPPPYRPAGGGNFRNGDAEGWTWQAPFLHSLWVGDDERGLTFICESPEAWNGPDAGRIELAREAGGLEWRMRLLRAPWTDPRYRLQFGLHPTPVKPLGPRMLGTAYGADARVAWPLPWQQRYHGYPRAPDAVELAAPGGPAIDAFVADAHAAGSRVVAYLHCSMLSKHAPEWAWFGEDWRIPGVQFSWVPDGFRVAVKEGDPPDWLHGVCPASGWAEFQLALLRDYVTRHRLDGIHFDFAAPWECGNAAHGCRAGRMPIFAWREFFKRAYVMMKELDRPTVIGQHTSINSGVLCSALVSFADIYLENENTSVWASEFGRAGPDWPVTRLPLEYYRIRLAGTPFGVRGMPVWAEGWSRGAVGMSLLHDITAAWGYFGPRTADAQALYRGIHAGLREFGVNDDGVMFIPYWQEQAWPREPADVKVSRYEHPAGRSLLVVVNTSPRAGGAVRLGAGPGIAARDLLTGEPLPIRGDVLDVSLPAHDFRLIRLDASPPPPVR